jgi:hypothetical protein
MTNFKIGDRIKFVKELGDNAIQYHLVLNKIYLVTRIECGFALIKRDNGSEWIIMDECFKLIKKEFVKETDYLDAFQENFKDGV